MQKKASDFKDDIIDSWDMFAVPPPQLNLNKKERVGTFIGFLFSMSILVTVMLFAGTKFIQLWERQNPNITSQEESGIYSDATD